MRQSRPVRDIIDGYLDFWLLYPVMLRIFISYLSGFKEANFVSCFAFKIVLQFLVADMALKLQTIVGHECILSSQTIGLKLNLFS